MEPEPIRTLGKYELVERIGHGGYGVVWKGFDPVLKRWVAIKVCQSEEPEFRQRFFREAEIAGRLDHPHIVRIFDLGLDGETPYLVQELLTGEDLDRKLESGRPFPLAERLRVLHQVAQGLSYAHSRDVVHRDVKPGNVRIVEEGGAKILDFGIAQLMHVESALTQTGLTLGTAAYLAPEQIRGEPTDHRTDIFSFGVLAYQTLSGQPPFGRDTISATLFQILNEEPPPLTSVCSGCPPAVERLVGRCLRKLPDDRFQLTPDLVDALAAARRGPPARGEPLGAATTRPIRLDTAPIPRPPSLARLPLETTPQPFRAAAARPRGRRGLRIAVLLLIAALSLLALARRHRVPERVAVALRPAPAAAAAEAVAAGSGAAATGADAARPPGSRASEPSPGRVSETEPPSPTPAPAAAEVPSAPPVEPSPPAAEPAALAPAAEPAAEAEAPAPSVLLLPRAWSPRIAVSVDGGPPLRLDRPRAVELAAGQHELTFVLDLPGYRALEGAQVRLAAGERRRLEIPIRPPGLLTVQARLGSPQARVQIDDQPPRTTPLRRHPLAPGSHRVRFLRADGSSGPGSTLTIRGGRETVITFDLTGRRELSVRERPIRRP